MPRPLHIACLQTRPMPTMTSAIDEARPMVEAAAQAGAQMVFLPEFCGGLRSDGVQFCPPSEPEQVHPVLAALRDLARHCGIWINIGSIAINGPQGKILNRGYMIDDHGEIFGHYDKLHLFDVDLSAENVYRESETVQAGNTARIYETPFAKIGHTICYDLRFPGLFRDLAQAGAEIICCPAAFTKISGEAHWHILNRARAIENTCFVVSPCAIGPVPGGGESYGHSLVVSPWGDVLTDGSNLPGVLHAQLDLDLVDQTARRVPSLQHDRDYSLRSMSDRSVA